MASGRIFFGILILAELLLIVGCGSDCSVVALNVVPATANANHSAATPNNSQTFTASNAFSSGCQGVGTAAMVSSNWAASDASVQLSPSPATNVTATCTAAVAGSITITATSASGQKLTGKATLTCN